MACSHSFGSGWAEGGHVISFDQQGKKKSSGEIPPHPKRPQESTVFSFWKEVKVSSLKLGQPSCHQPEDEDRRRRRSGEIRRETDPGPWHTAPEARQRLAVGMILIRRESWMNHFFLLNTKILSFLGQWRSS